MAFAAAAPLVLAAVGTAISAAGMIQAGNAQKAAANYQAEIARNNATIAEQNAQAAIKAGAAKTEVAGLRARQGAGAVLASRASSGIDVNSGSALDTEISEREVGKLDTEQVAHNAQMDAYGYRSQGISYTAQSRLDTAQGAQAAIAGDIGAAGTLIGNAGSLGLKYQQMQTAGV